MWIVVSYPLILDIRATLGFMDESIIILMSSTDVAIDSGDDNRFCFSGTVSLLQLSGICIEPHVS